MKMDASVLHADPSLSRNVFSLTGIWEIQPGGDDVPTAEWQRRVQVPGLVDLAVPQYDWRRHKYHWYRKVFKIDPPFSSEAALLTLEQAMFGTEVWLNGRRVGCDIACYTSQEYDVRDFLILGAANELLVRVGAKETLPQQSAVGKDQERTDFIPGIWGDVHFTLCGNPRIKLVQVIPHIESKHAEVRVTIANNSERESRVRLRCMVQERRSGLVTSPERETAKVVPPQKEVTLTLSLPIQDLHLWSPDDPFLYQVESKLSVDGALKDCVHTTYGMREFRIAGSDFFLNGKKVFLKGGNIAFHRFLSDADRGGLPWDLDWVKKLLIDIPKAHNFNFFRNHIGQLYNRWFYIADEYGMLLQNEWMFWTATGTQEQITKEFTRWVQDNWNHPSIIIWDALNESSDTIVQNNIVPEMKMLDPTRPWESVDFVEQHPYIYSLGPVLNQQKLGFTMALDELQEMATPCVVNEFLWWWLDKEWKPTVLMEGVVERWLGKDFTKDELVERQSFLAQELVELFRRMRVDAIQPFVYLSNNGGPTANWFVGNIKELQPKPILKTLKNAFSPFGISLEIWDRHFLVGEYRSLRLYIFNDDAVPRTGTVRYGVVRFDDGWIFDTSLKVSVDPGESVVNLIHIMLPRRAGEYRIRAELLEGGSDTVVAYTEKIAHVFDSISDANLATRSSVVVHETSGEIGRFLAVHGFPVFALSDASLAKNNVVVVGEGKLKSDEYQSQLNGLSSFVSNGGTLVVIEPEYGVLDKEVVSLLPGLTLTIERRVDADKSGYDSYLFPEDLAHPLWSGIEKKHLQMFNGGFGGEVISQHDVICSMEHWVYARCGLNLAVEAVFEIPFGKGSVVVSRLQLRGRLVRGNTPDTLFTRRPDPVLQRYLLNLTGYASKR
jgi:hypothetical protein